MIKPIVIVSIVILLGLGYFAWQSNQVSDVNNTGTESQTEVTNIVNDSSNNLDVKIDENKNKSQLIWVQPYTGELPPMPDKKLNDSTLLWIDTNANGVRDDLEREIVETYGSDKMVVEAFFAYVRSRLLDLLITQEGRFTDDLYEDNISVRSRLSTWCRAKYLNESLFINDITELYNISQEFSKLIYNTNFRKKINKEFFSNLDNKLLLWWLVSKEECEIFFEKSKKIKLY